MEEPVCDPPAVSLHYVSKLARSHAKVLLSGEGGDEAFGGYYDYRNLLLLERLKTTLPFLKGTFSALLGVADQCKALRKLSKFSPFFAMPPHDYYYSRSASPFSFFNRNKKELYTPSFYASVCPEASVGIIRALFDQIRGQPLLDQLQYIDTKTSLPDDLLIKADRITMGNSVELRVPFLDHKILEFAASLPPHYKVRGLQTKRILKKVFGERIPKAILHRKKAGFPIPIERWMQRDLKDEVRQVLLSKRSLERGHFSKSGLEKLLAFSEPGKPVAKEIFALLTLELLLVEFVDGAMGQR